MDKFGRKFLFIEGGIQASPLLLRLLRPFTIHAACTPRSSMLRLLCLLDLLRLQMCMAQIVTGVVLAVEFPKCECCAAT